MSDPLSLRRAGSRRLTASGGRRTERREGNPRFASAGEEFGPGELGEPTGVRRRERFVPQPPYRVADRPISTNLDESPPPGPQHVTVEVEKETHRAPGVPDSHLAGLVRIIGVDCVPQLSEILVCFEACALRGP